MSWLFTSGGQSIGASALASDLPMNIQSWFPLELTGLISLQSKGLSRVCSKTTVQKHQFFDVQPSLWSQLSYLYMITGKTRALTIKTFADKGMSLLFNTLSRFVVAFLLRIKHLLIPWLQSPSAVILEPKKRKSVTVSIVSHLFALKLWDQMLWSWFSECWVLSQLFHSPLLPSSRSSLGFVHFLPLGWYIWAYLSLLILFPAVLFPACASSSLAVCMMYSAYKLNKQDDKIQSWCTPFPIWNQSVVPCLFLTVASWPAYRFLKKQVRWSGIPISLRTFYSWLWSTQSKALA